MSAPSSQPPAEPTRAIAPVTAPPAAPVAIGYGTVEGFVGLQRVAKAFAESRIVPETFRGNVADCIIALEMANRMGASPLMVMQNMHVIHGRVGWSSQFLISAFNSCGRFGPIKYRWFGEKGTDAWGCAAVSRDLTTGEPIEGPEVTIGMAKAEGWFGRSGSKWKTMPQLMLTYRSAAFLVRTTAPELTMGIRPVDELEDMDLPAPRWVAAAPVGITNGHAEPPPAVQQQPASPPPPVQAPAPAAEAAEAAAASPPPPPVAPPPAENPDADPLAPPAKPRVGKQLETEILDLVHAVGLTWGDARAEYAEDLGLTTDPLAEQDVTALMSLRAVLKQRVEEKAKRSRKPKGEPAGAGAEG